MELKPGQLIEHRDYRYRAVITSITQYEIELFIFYNPTPKGADSKHYTIGPKSIGTFRRSGDDQSARYWLNFFKRVQ